MKSLEPAMILRIAVAFVVAYLPYGILGYLLRSVHPLGRFALPILFAVLFVAGLAMFWDKMTTPMRAVLFGMILGTVAGSLAMFFTSIASAGTNSFVPYANAFLTGIIGGYVEAQLTLLTPLVGAIAALIARPYAA